MKSRRAFVEGTFLLCSAASTRHCCPKRRCEHADSVVVGYAEESWPRLLRDFAAGRMLRRYDQNPNLKLANLPFPQRQLFDKAMVNVAHTIEATRGCIYQCEFCVVPAAWGQAAAEAGRRRGG